MTILDLLDAARRDRGTAPAIGDVTYDGLVARAARVATGFADVGIERGDRVAIYSENRQGFIDAYLGALRLGAVVVPTNVLYRSADLGHVLRDAAAKLVVASAAQRPHVEGLDDPPPVIDIAHIEAWASGDGALHHGVRVRDDEIAVIVYTSGTTGRSKGAMLPHGAIAAIATQVASAWRWSSSDTLYIALPLFHLHGLGAALNGSIAAGGRIIIEPRFDAARTLDVLRRDDVTMFFGVPTMYVRLLEALGSAPAPRLRVCVSGSAALDATTFETFRGRFGMEIVERYGATEFGFALTNRYGGTRVPGSVGIPFAGVSVRVVDADANDVAEGAVGELLVHGPNVFAGYWRDPQKTAAAFLTGSDGRRWYRSGDLARYDVEHGVYRIVGRQKELIISGGFNVYPREVESEIDGFPGVRASALVGVVDAARGEIPVAFIEADEVDPAALLAYLGARLASFKLPKRMHRVDALPRNALGKIEKHRLAEPAVPGASL